MSIKDRLESPLSSKLGRRLRIRVGVVLGLLFLIGPISDLADAPLGDVHLALLAAGLAAFVVLYVLLLPPSPLLLRLSPDAPYVALALLGALAIVLVTAGGPNSFVALFVYFVAAAGIVLRPRDAMVVTIPTAAGVWIGALAVGASGAQTAVTVLTIVSIGAMMAAFGRQIRVNTELRAAREELARLAVTEERLRIARDLHDLLGHTLSVISLKTELAAKLVERDPRRAATELGEVQTVTRHALTEVREAVHGYRQLALDDALDGARSALAAAGIELQLDKSDVSLPPEVAAVLAWAVREGTTNVVRHSGARTCAIHVSADETTAAVEVEDDGSGAIASTSGSGLAGLAERAARVRGRLETGTRPGGGFRLRLTVPLAA
jgi:two-component system sensor histidine kinase DesK